jgi:hypothetical protein
MYECFYVQKAPDQLIRQILQHVTLPVSHSTPRTEHLISSLLNAQNLILLIRPSEIHERSQH